VPETCNFPGVDWKPGTARASCYFSTKIDQLVPNRLGSVPWFACSWRCADRPFSTPNSASATPPTLLDRSGASRRSWTLAWKRLTKMIGFLRFIAYNVVSETSVFCKVTRKLYLFCTRKNINICFLCIFPQKIKNVWSGRHINYLNLVWRMLESSKSSIIRKQIQFFWHFSAKIPIFYMFWTFLQLFEVGYMQKHFFFKVEKPFVQFFGTFCINCTKNCNLDYFSLHWTTNMRLSVEFQRVPTLNSKNQLLKRKISKFCNNLLQK